MLIEFTVGNFRSIGEPIILSMSAAKLRGRSALPKIDPLIPVRSKLSVLRTAVVYGANASGKSNLFRAFLKMKSLVLDSARAMPEDAIDVEPFRLDTALRESPSLFEVVFVLEGTQYRYGFEADQVQVHREWLYALKTRETILFVRDGDDFNVKTAFGKRKAVEEATDSNALFLSRAAMLKHPVAKAILRWFNAIPAFLDGVTDTATGYTATQLFDDQNFAQKIRDFICALDLSIEGINAQEKELPEHPEDVRFFEIQTHHPLFKDGQATDETVLFNLLKEESGGTQKLFSLAGPVIDTLNEGLVLFFDEFDARLHPRLSRAILNLFNDPETNPKGAQLVVFTHDDQFLDPELLRRDQIWFVEKDRQQQSQLYSLASFKVRNDHAYAKRYAQGRYGAVPFVGQLVTHDL